MDNETRTNFTWQQKHQEKIKPILGAALGHEIFTQSTFHYDAVYGVDLILIPDNFS